MEWQAVVVVLQILMLVVGWVLFQQARTELSARAAEAPVLAEVKALQRSVGQLIQELKHVSETTADQLERRCDETRDLMAELDRRLETLSNTNATLSSRADTPCEVMIPVLNGRAPRAATPTVPKSAPRTSRSKRGPASAGSGDPASIDRQSIYTLADQGESAASIAHRVGMSEGEIETLIGLRRQTR